MDNDYTGGTRSVYTDIQLTSSLAKLLQAMDRVYLVPNTAKEANAAIDALSMNLLGMQPQPKYLPDILSYICNLWSSGTITVKELGYINYTTQQLEALQ